MTCLDDRVVHAWIGGGLPETERDVVRTHLDTCDSCRDLVASAIEGQWIGRTAGRYQLRELIGAGAMGEVYRAADPELGRDIAIKIVHPGGSQQRLLREAQVMARLAHANVIRIYDVGMVADHLFLAMELIEGTTLRGWFETARDWREVVATLRAAGDGLAAAHAAGLVHGDFKPDNVLVARDGRVLVTDFGLARVASDEAPATEVASGPASTQTRGLIGTPAYMAPEQLDGAAATAASDQFSFCVTLFEGVYGRRPFQGSDVETLRTAQRELAIPARPATSRIARALRRGLARRPTERYPAIGDLLAELAPPRRGMVVAAGGVLAGGALVAALVLRGGGGPSCDGTDQLAGIWDAAARATVERAFDASGLPYAKPSSTTVVRQLDRYAETWASTYAETCGATERGAQSAALLDLRMHCLERRRVELRAVVEQIGGGNKEVLRDSVAATLALPSVAECADVESLKELQLPAEDRRISVGLLEQSIARCRSLAAAGNYREATPCAAQAARQGKQLEHGPSQAEAELLAGQIALRLRSWPEAEAAFDRALLAAEAGRDARTRARVLIGLVSVAGERAVFDQGHKQAEHATAVIDGLDHDPELAGDLAMAAGVLALREGKFEVAIETLGKAVGLREKLFGKDDARVVEPLVPMAVAYTSRSKYDEAKRLLERALAIETAARGDQHPAVGKALHALSQVQARMGQPDAALASQKRSLAILRAAYGEEHADVAQSIGAEATINLLAGRYAEAAPAARRAAELMEKVAGPDHPDTATALVTLAAVLNRAGDTDGALAAHQRALAIRMTALGPNHLHTTQSQVNTAMALRAKKRPAEALALLEAARAVRIKQLGPDHTDVLRTEQSIADCHVDLGHAEQAVPLLEHALAIYDKLPRRSADEKVTYAQANYGLARALWDAKPESAANRDRAKLLVKRAHADFVALADRRAEQLAEWATKRRIPLD